MTSTAWGGLLNGQIPLVRMTVVRGEHFEPQAAAQLLKLEAAFEAHFGKPAIILEGYRSLATQQQYWSDWQAGKPGAHHAAYPGTSNHGFGRAADFASSIDLFDSAEHQWMVANAPTYGWHWGEAPDEAWHFTYYPGTAAAGGNATPIIEREETPMGVMYYRTKNDKRGGPIAEWALAGTSPGTPANWLVTTNQEVATEMATSGAGGSSVFLGKVSYDTFRASYLAPLNIAGGTVSSGSIDVAAIVKAIAALPAQIRAAIIK